MKRFPNKLEGKCGAVVAGGLVHAVATDPAHAKSVSEQIQNTLRELDRILTQAGSNRSKLIQVTVYLNDIADKPQLDLLWKQWIGPAENWPQRSCVGVQLESNCLIEIVVIAEVGLY